MAMTAIPIGLHPDVVDYESPEFAWFPDLAPGKLQAAHDGNIEQLRQAGFDVDGCARAPARGAVRLQQRRSYEPDRYPALVPGSRRSALNPDQQASHPTPSKRNHARNNGRSSR
jgi:hypothetical protein